MDAQFNNIPRWLFLTDFNRRPTLTSMPFVFQLPDRTWNDPPTTFRRYSEWTWHPGPGCRWPKNFSTRAATVHRRTYTMVTSLPPPSGKSIDFLPNSVFQWIFRRVLYFKRCNNQANPRENMCILKRHFSRHYTCNILVSCIACPVWLNCVGFVIRSHQFVSFILPQYYLWFP